MSGLPPEVESEVQKLLRKWEEEELTEELFLTREQAMWLGRAVHIFQAHELQSNKNWRDKLFTEAMCRKILSSFSERTVRKYRAKCGVCDGLNENFEFSEEGFEEMKKKIAAHQKHTGHYVNPSVEKLDGGKD